MISWLQRMQAISPNVTLFGSVWSPPLWMKSNVSNDLLPQFFQAWVGYIMQYLASYQARGVDVAAITMQACRTTLSAPSLSIITPPFSFTCRTSPCTAATPHGRCTWTPPHSRHSRALFLLLYPPVIRCHRNQSCGPHSCGLTTTTPTCPSILLRCYHQPATASAQWRGTATLLTAQAGASSTTSTTTILISIKS